MPWSHRKEQALREQGVQKGEQRLLLETPESKASCSPDSLDYNFTKST
jgi:hypothetical protein